MTFTITTNKRNELVATTNFEKIGEYWYDGGGIACKADDLRKQEFTLSIYNNKLYINHREYNKNYQGFCKGQQPIENYNSDNKYFEIINALKSAL